MSKFDNHYATLGSEVEPERKRVDYVLIYELKTTEKAEKEERDHIEKNDALRQRFETALQNDQIVIQKEEQVVDRKRLCVTKLHVPFKRLCAEVEKVNLEMPLENARDQKVEPTNKIAKFIKDHFETDDEVDFVSGPFNMDTIHLYKNHKDRTNFFRPALRSLLTHHILINMDLREEEEKKCRKSKKDEEGDLCGCFGGNDSGKNVEDKVLQKIGLPYLLLKKVYTDSFTLHDVSARSYAREEEQDGEDGVKDKKKKEEEEELEFDPRKHLDDTWPKVIKFQPLWKIRNYFGEKIALYFAWSGTLITSLWIPMLFGLAIFIYGLFKSGQARYTANQADPLPENATTGDTISAAVTDLLEVIKEAFDNEVTPFFGLVICVWGTIFLEMWKRKTARLAYQWDVEEFEANEPDRPEFFGTRVKTDPVTELDSWFYPMKRRLAKFAVSGISLLFMILIVVVSVVAVLVYRVFASVDFCPTMNATQCLMVTTIVSSILNAVSILILGKLYDWMARKLTDWENHRTQTQFDDALIIKLFAFQFANNYASCFYIAFFRGRFDSGGIFGRGSSYQDDCVGNCMSQLSFQVLVLMITKPLPKFFSDIVLPFAMSLWRKRPCCKGKVEDKDGDSPLHKQTHSEQYKFMKRQIRKPTLGDFTLGEYTEKIIQYGFLMLFAASFPLAPLFALITNLVDIRVDAKRMLWWYRRPIAIVAQDIGTWFTILQIMNFCGVASNGFLIAFTSSWGSQFDTIGKLWVVIGFEHICFLLKFILAYFIPDVPSDIVLAKRKKRHFLDAQMDKLRLERENEIDLLRNSTRKSNNHRLSENVYMEKSTENFPDVDYQNQPEYRDDPSYTEERVKRRRQVPRSDSQDLPTYSEVQQAPAKRRKQTPPHRESQEKLIYNEVQQTPVKKVRRKKRTPRREDTDSDLEDRGEYIAYQLPPTSGIQPHQRLSSQDGSSNKVGRVPSFKLKGPRGEEIAELPLSSRGSDSVI